MPEREPLAAAARREGDVFFHNRAKNQKLELLLPPDETRKNSPAIVGGKVQLDRTTLPSEQEGCSVAHETLPMPSACPIFLALQKTD